ncbi:MULTISPECIES: hypothetical protein [unclassified Bradyrhizobium]
MTSFSSTRSTLSMRAASQRSNVASETSTHTQEFTERSAVVSISPKYWDEMPSISIASSKSSRGSSLKNTSTNTTKGSAACPWSRIDR